MASSFQWQSVCLAILIFYAGASLATSRLLPQSSISEMHEQWMSRQGRVYKDAVEKELRFKIFKDNLNYIQSFNSIANQSYYLSLNKFADLTNEEFRSYHNGFKRNNSQQPRLTGFRYEKIEKAKLPSSLDWRKFGAVTHVKDQGQCGSCWAFSAVATVEGISKIKTGKLVSLSEQEIVDCDYVPDEAEGCDGGYMDIAFQFIKKKGGITSEANYPYKGVNDTCKKAKENSVVAKITGYEDVPANSEASLLKAVVHQPVSVSIDAGAAEFQFYSAGVFTGECGTDLDHGVTLVGYGKTQKGTKYWLVKNSWGTDWGEDGYVKIKRNVRAKEGLCGIAMDASYPIIA
ncbi:senescence-specific cysteine protease SAG39-like [Telopea speciosissima]|uniref:senescence-specific cysteine protease SAG39-like n=1 Tax=Telopea speciosissima TaxID=54955 RepID=UPI001CC4B862|nr:senescence-specific cysteine protease SAG39-like [Telopea speciosissima]